MAISRRGIWPAVGAWLVFMASAGTLIATLVARAPLLPMHELREYHLLDELRAYHFFDLKVYRRAASIVSQGRPLYATKLRHGLGFTYPPIAVLMFLSLRWLSVRGDELAVTIVNIALLAVIAHAALRLQRPRAQREGVQSRDARRRWRLIAAGWLAAAAALWVEPVMTTLGYGQIDLLITALVVVDLVYGRSSRAGGLGIGLAAALKLTPLVFIPYLVLTGRTRMAGRALAAFALSIAVALVVLPGDAWTYWFGGKFTDVSRVTGGTPLAGSGAANQSLRGTVLRIFAGTPHVTVIWLVACLVVGGIGLLLGVRAARRGDEAWGFTLIALTGLLVSPVSWTHHWTIAVAGVIALVGSRGRPVVTVLRAIAVTAFGLGASAIWLVIALGPGRHPGTVNLLLGNLYVFAGLGAIVTAAGIELRRSVHRRATGGRRTGVIAPLPAARRPALAPTPLVAAPGHSGDTVRAITTSQGFASDRQSLR